MQKKHQPDIPKPLESSLNLPDLSDRHQRGLLCTPHTKAFSRLSANLSAREVSWQLLQKHLSSPSPPFYPPRRCRGCWAWPQETGDGCLPTPCLSFLICKMSITAALPSMSYYDFLDLSTQGPFPHGPTDHRERARPGQESKHTRAASPQNVSAQRAGPDVSQAPRALRCPGKRQPRPLLA